MSKMKCYNFGFILEQTLGHITHGQNLRTNVAKDRSINAHWGLVDWQVNGLAAQLPLYKSNWTIRSGLRARRQISQFQRKVNLDAIFFHSQVPAVLNIDSIRRIPSIVSLDATPKQYDDLGDYYVHDTSSAWLESQKWRLNRACFANARHLITWSQWAKESLVADYEVPAEKVTVVPPGVNVTEWLSPAPRTDDGRVLKILFVGGDLKRKGGLLLLDAFRSLLERLPSGSIQDIELHMVTKDNIAPELGVFVYNDLEPNSHGLKKLFHDCHIFCLPTFGDCLPMVLSEAAAAGMPIVSTDVGAIPEIVHDGESGIIVPANETSKLAAALTALIENSALRHALGTRATEIARCRYDAEKNARQLLNVLKEKAAESYFVRPTAPYFQHEG